jgi:hypothetical protein
MSVILRRPVLRLYGQSIPLTGGTSMLKTPSLAAVLLCCGTAQAALIDRGGGLIYDDVLNVTWLQNAGAGGELSWTDAKAWADQLSVFDSVRGLTWSDWRLPDTQPINGVAWNLAPTTDGSSDWGYNIVSPQHELAHLFHVGLQNLSAYASDGSLRPGLAASISAWRIRAPLSAWCRTSTGAPPLRPGTPSTTRSALRCTAAAISSTTASARCTG